jgi:hypothetical protein
MIQFYEPLVLHFMHPQESQTQEFKLALLAARDWRVAGAIAEIGYANPFLPERIELEKKALGKAFTDWTAVPAISPRLLGERHVSQRHGPAASQRATAREDARTS